MMKDKTHILLPIWYPIGGIRTFLRYVYGSFSPDSYQLTILLPESSELDATREDLGRTEAHFEVLRKNPSIFAFISRIIHILREQQIDIIHSQGFTSGILAALPARLSRTPHLLTSHDVLRKEQFQGVNGYVKKLLLPSILEIPDMIHSVSHDAQENLFKFFPQLRKKPQRRCVIPNGIDTKRFLIEERTDLKKKIGLSDKSFLIGYWGRFMRQKGFDILVDAINSLSQSKSPFDFRIVAFGWGGFIREEQELLARRGLTKYFSFLPFEPNVAKVLRGVDVVVVPSRWEACPLLPMEALVSGAPVIGTDCLGLREVLCGTPAKLVPAGDSKSLAEALIDEMKNPTHRIANDFRQKAALRFDVKTQTEELERILLSLLVNPKKKI